MEMFHGLTPEEQKALVNNSGKFKKFVASLLPARSNSVQTSEDTSWQAEWQKFYQQIFGMEVNLSEITLPPETAGFGWLIVMAQGLTLNQALAACKKSFSTWAYSDDLNRDVSTNDRTPADGSYAIRIRDRVEADKENKSLSADTIKERGLTTMTLLERIILELWYFSKHKKHLDLENITLCSGSCYSDGRVPYCDWRGDGFKVYWCGPDDARDRLRARSAVSLVP